MGAWEIGNFGNDDAMDLVSDVHENGKAELLRAIQKISGSAPDEYLEAPDCSMALAAVEYIAAAGGKPSGDFPEEAATWITKNRLLPFTAGGEFGIGAKITDIVTLSKQAIDKIITNSELKELWEESEEFKDWLNIAEGLKKRIS